MTTTLNDIKQQLDSILVTIQTKLNNVQVTGKQVTVLGGLSDIDGRLGTIQAGEFRTGNGKLPDKGFTGVRIGFPAFTYVNEPWHLVGVNNDVLQVGINAEDGKLYAGGGAVVVGSGGVDIYVGATHKTAIQSDGDFFIGSDIDAVATTTMAIFTVAQTYNGESMGAGDLILGNAAAGHVFYDASTGRLNFRNVTTVQAYIDTTGQIIAGAGGVTLNTSGIVLTNVSGVITFLTAAGADGAYIFNEGTDDLAIQNNRPGKALVFYVTTTSNEGPSFSWQEDPANADATFLDINPGSAGGRAAFGSDHLIDFLDAGGNGSATVWFNERGHDIDFVIKDDTDTTAFQVDAAAHTVSIYGTAIHLPVAETNSNAVFQVNAPGGPSIFVATINGTPSGTSVVYNAPSSGTEAAIVPASTSQLAKMRLYNTTRSNSALISDVNTGTNTITLTATVPANWANGDTITIASQTVSGGGANWVDLEVTSSVLDKTELRLTTIVRSNVAGDILRVHPLETFAAAKLQANQTPVASTTINSNSAIFAKMTSNVFSIAWNGTWTNAADTVTLRLTGYLE